MTDPRYSIRGWMIVDAESDPVPEIYIRELLDMPSAEFRRSWLDEQQRMEIIHALGLETLIKVLDDCYRQGGKNYNAAQEAELTVLMLNKILERQALPPALAEVSPEAQPVIKFMRQYFAERASLETAADERSAAFRKRCFTTDYLTEQKRDWDEVRNFADQNPATVVEVTLSDNEANVVTSEPEGESIEAKIYHLRRAGEGWQIDGKGRKCYMCEGTGRSFKEGKSCGECNGSGWRYAVESAG